MIMIIVLSHFEFLQRLPDIGEFYLKYLHNAVIAVDFFFLLSGFGMMLGSLAKVPEEELSAPTIQACFRYGIRHIRKIYPLYLATMIFSVLAKFAYAIYDSKFTFSYIAHEAVKIVVNVLLLQSMSGMMFFITYNLAAWFLSTLFCIYLVSPLLIWVLRKISRTNLTHILLAVANIAMAVILAVAFEKVEAFSKRLPGPDIDNMVYVSPFRRVFYVLLGMNLAMIFHGIKSSGAVISGKILNIAEATVSLLALAFFFARNSFPRGVYLYAIDMVICAILVLTFAFDGGRISAWLSKPAMQRLGRVSMYIFLVHYPIRLYFSRLVSDLFENSLLTAVLFIVFIMTTTVLITEILYRRDLRKLPQNPS